jgi:hypothetical protein
LPAKWSPGRTCAAVHRIGAARAFPSPIVLNGKHDRAGEASAADQVLETPIGR